MFRCKPQSCRRFLKAMRFSSAAIVKPIHQKDKSFPIFPTVAGLVLCSAMAIQAESKPKRGQHELFPALEPYKVGTIQVSEIHTLHYEECGNPQGKPVVLVHGGPGAGCSAQMRQFHNPEKYRIILFDQRGAGKSTPHACLKDNTTWHLIEDMEKLRRHLNVEQWQVFGGSWGSTLSIAYAQLHPTRVTELILRGIFHLRKKELEFYYQHGASMLFPDRFEAYQNAIPAEEQHDMIAAYHKRLTCEDPAIQSAAAAAWTTWEKTTSQLIPDVLTQSKQESKEYLHFAQAFARIENHYFYHKGFFPTDAYLLEQTYKIRHIPTVIVQGRYDVVCPTATAWEFAKAFPEADFQICPTSGHSHFEPAIRSALIAATEKYS